MSEMRQSQSMTTSDVRTLLLDALRTDEPVSALNESLASVDWSTVSGPVPPEVAEMLGEAEGLAIEFAEGDLSPENLLRSIERLASTWNPIRPPLTHSAESVTIREEVVEPPIRTRRFSLSMG